MNKVGKFIKKVYWRVLRLFGVKGHAWDLQFKEGIWCRGAYSPHALARVVELCRGGRLLEFGCGEATLVHLLPRDSYSDYLGIDISGVAIRTAIEKCAKAGISRCQFQVGDMENWTGSTSTVSLILLDECLYYLSPPAIKRFLLRCCSNLTPGGAILVTVHSAKKHAKTLSICRRVCRVLDERTFGSRVLLTLTPYTVSAAPSRKAF